MSRLIVLDTNCLVQMLSVHSPFPTVTVIGLEEFVKEVEEKE